MLKITIIIPVKPGGTVSALNYLTSLDYPPECLEIIVAEGRKPSLQRNLAAQKASGEILYFLDDDSHASPTVLTLLDTHYKDKSVVAVGGPSLTPQTDSKLQRAIGAVLSSSIGGSRVRNRYRKYGNLRKTDDSELILCNLSFRKDYFLEAGGLNEKLYPNEENELIDRLLSSGLKMLHEPEMAVFRSQRRNLRQFVRQIFTYGRGRAEQTLLSKKIMLTSLLPLFFVLYLLSLSLIRSLVYAGPMLLYLFIVTFSAIYIGLKERSCIQCLISMMLIPLMHIVYGAGEIAGFLAPRFKHALQQADEVSINIVKKFV